MSDYNLGTAHGRIVIDYDGHGGQQAQSDFQKVADKASWLHGRLRTVGAGISQFANNFGSDMQRVGRSVSYLAGAAAIIGAVTASTGRLGAGLIGLRGGVGALLTLAAGMRGLPSAAQGFPNIVKQAILLSAGLTALRSGTRVLSMLAGRFALLRPAAPIIRALGDGLFRLGRPVRAIAGVALAIAGLIRGVSIATSLAKSILGLTAAFGALSGVVGIIAGLIGALSQLSGVLGLIPALGFAAAASLAALAVGFSGMGKAMKFVAPAAGGAAGGMNQAANAAKNAARQIASAQRAVADALKDQARVARDTARQVADAQRAVRDAVEAAAEANIQAAKAVKRAQRDLADAIKDAADSAVQSARRVADAQKAVARAAEDGARSVVAASRNLASAVKNEASAQRNLNDARATAIQQLKDLKELVSDLALDQEGAAINLIEAQQNLEKVNSDALSTELDRRKAQYELAVAQERVNDVTEEAAKAVADKAAADAKGVDGNQAVIDANEAVKDSQQAIIDAQDEYVRAVRDASESNAAAAQDLADAVRAAADDRIDSERRVSDAAESLAEAQSEQAKTAADGARSIADAQQALADAELSAAEARADAAQRVEDAYRQLAEAQEDAAQSMANAAGAAAGAEDPINKLSKNAQELVRTLRGLADEWTIVKHAVQDALFAGIAKEVQDLAGIYLPILKEGLVGIASEFNRAAKEASGFLKEQQTQDDMREGFSLTAVIIHNLTNALRPLLSAFRDIGVVGLQVMADLTGGAGGAAQRFADFIAEARKTGDLKIWIENGVQAFRDLWNIVKNVGASISLVFEGLSGSDGSDFLANLRAGTEAMRAFLESAKGQEILRELGGFLDRMATNSLALLSAAFEHLWPVVLAIKPLFEQLSGTFTGVFATALSIIGPMLTKVAEALVWMSPVIVPLLGTLLGLGIAWKTLAIAARLLLPLFGLLSAGIKTVTLVWNILKFAFFTNPWVGIIAAVIALVVIIVTNWDTISAALGTAWEWIKTTAVTVWNSIIDFFKEWGLTILAVITGPIGWIVGLIVSNWDWIVATTTTIWNGIVNFFTTVWNSIVSFFTTKWEEFKGKFQLGLQYIAYIWSQIWETVSKFFSETWNKIVTWFVTKWAELQMKIQLGLAYIQYIWNEIWEKVSNFFSETWNKITTFLSNAWEKIKLAVANGAANVWLAIRNMGDSIINFFAGAGSWLYNAGRDIILGLWNGIAGMGQWLWGKIMNWARTYIPGPILSFLGIASPSKLFRDEIGKMIPAGLMVGVDSMAGKVKQTMTHMVENAKGAAISAARTGNLAGALGTELAGRLPTSGLIADAATATRATTSQAVPLTPASQGEQAVVDAANTVIESLTLQVAGNLDPTNKLAWDQAMDKIREGIRTREKIRK